MRNAAAENLLSITNSTGMAVTEDAFAEHLDASDRLHIHRQSFHFPQHREGNFVYLVGNSLGLQHVGVEPAIASFLKKWRDQAVEGYFMQPNPWFEIDQALRKDMANLVGASESEVILMNTLTVNLHVMMSAFYHPKGAKRKIMESQGFPSNTHDLVSQLEIRGFNAAEDLIPVSAPGHEDWQQTPSMVPTDVFLNAIEKHGDNTAIVVLSAVHFLTGQFFDIGAIVKAAKAKKMVVGVDCSHAVGNVPLRLHDWDVDFACWCTYKYLNSGPGNIGGAFVHSKHTQIGSGVSHLKGWWGHDQVNHSSLHRTFEPADGAAAFQMSAPPAMGLTALSPSLKLMSSIGIDSLREKSMHLTAYMELLLNELIPPGCIDMLTPVDPAQRGAQLSLRIVPNRLRSRTASTEAYPCGTGSEDSTSDAVVVQLQLLDAGVMVDSRPPDIIRLAPAPLYNSYMDVLTAVRALGSLF